MRTSHLALLAASLAISACAGGGGGAPATACVAGAACTPAAACSRGEVRCEGGLPTCIATTPLPDGSTCGEGATCGSGTCQRTITVIAIDRYVDDAGQVVEVPRWLGDTVFRALVLDAAGDYQAYPGSLVAPGVVAIPGVPAGVCWLESRYVQSTVPTLIELSGNVFDQSSDLAGRPGVGGAATQVELSVTGLAPWLGATWPSDQIQVVASNAGEFVEYWPEIPEGATQASLLPWGSLAAPRLDGAAGDRVQVVQLGRVDGPLPYLAALRSGTLPDTFRVEDGAAVVVPVALEPIVRTGTIEADWALGEMEALLGEMGPWPGQYRSHQLRVAATPHGLPNVYPTLLAVETAGDGTLQVGPLAYGRPYPDFFVDSAYATMTASMEVPLMLGWDPTLSVNVAASVSLGAPSAGRLVIRPEVSPPRAVRVAGLDVGRTVQMGVGTTPTISWSPPSLGGPDLRYQVSLYRVVAPYSFSVVRFSTASTAVKVPPDLLRPGVEHYARITAAGPTGYAQTVTAAFVP